MCYFVISFLFFCNDPAATEIYTLSLHDALPIFPQTNDPDFEDDADKLDIPIYAFDLIVADECHRGYSAQELSRSEEHTSELQSLRHLVCRLLLEKKNNKRSRLHSTDQTPTTKQY